MFLFGLIVVVGMLCRVVGGLFPATCCTFLPLFFRTIYNFLQMYVMAQTLLCMSHYCQLHPNFCGHT